MSTLSPEKPNTHSDSIVIDDDVDMAFHDTPSSPFDPHITIDDRENVAPGSASTPVKSLVDLDANVPQSASKVSPDKKSVLRERTSPVRTSPVKNLMDDFEGVARRSSIGTPRKSPSPTKEVTADTPGSAKSTLTRKSRSPSKSVHASTAEPLPRKMSLADQVPEISVTPSKRPASSPLKARELRDNEGLTAAMNFMETHREHHENLDRSSFQDHDFDLDTGLDGTDMHPDGPDATSDIDDTCFSTFSEMPGIDMTKFASLRQSPSRDAALDATPRPRAQMTPSTVRRTDGTPSPTPRRTYKENDTTNLLLDFTAQIESFSTSRGSSSGRGQTSPSKSSKDSTLQSYYQNQRSPAKGGANVPSTPSQSRQMLNLLDFELPPPPTPRSLPTVTIRELESVKSQFQSQISSLTASLSGKEAEIEALSRAIADAERRVGEAQETVREERSAREYAESQMVDWKSKGEEVQRLLQDVQAEMARNDAEREEMYARLAEAEKRAEDAENRSSDLETKLIEAESKNVDMTTFISNDEGGENKKIYSELECQAAIAEKVNEVARDLHTAYKAKHEKKIKALKDNYQRKADERCKELKQQIVSLERQVEEAEKKRDTKTNTGEQDAGDNQGTPLSKSTRNAEDAQMLEAQRAEIENLKAKLAGLQSELQSLRKSHDALVEDLEAERIEKGELVAAAEQMLSMCGEKMEEMQQEDFRRSQMSSTPPAAQQEEQQPQQQQQAVSHKPAPPQHQAMRNTGFLAGAPPRPGSSLGGGRPGSAMGERIGAMNERGGSTNSGVSKPSGLRAPGGLKFQGTPGLNRSTSGSKSRLMSNIERMGGGKSQQE
ncbi:uncharacterized protein SETTUDRAFT_141352 [Exserohilum turcica Et28A]|uniref:Uncharacterized protein n=1 Tax=Exserohilum turcicum (strain 28A) TaxID=671987 RepID=R0K3J5_EXST2|nr:uncharacterized protein SETTUDRAFT_141352 [Exserohilum turcica Et28A]EOA82952.1 hypothetical protein SETTUDRAFT_141352 [Exserohilum turcica Et28A]